MAKKKPRKKGARKSKRAIKRPKLVTYYNSRGEVVMQVPAEDDHRWRRFKSGKKKSKGKKGTRKGKKGARKGKKVKVKTRRGVIGGTYPATKRWIGHTWKKRGKKRGNIANLVQMPMLPCDRCGRLIAGGEQGIRTHQSKKGKCPKRNRR